MPDVVPLVHRQLGSLLGPGVVGEEALDLVVRGDAAGDVPAEAGREHDRADEERDEEGVDEAVLLQELVEPLVAAHPQHVPAVQVHVQGAAQPAEDPDEGEDEELHGVEGKRHLEGGHEHGHDRLLLIGEDGQQAEHQGPGHD